MRRPPMSGGTLLISSSRLLCARSASVSPGVGQARAPGDQDGLARVTLAAHPTRALAPALTLWIYAAASVEHHLRVDAITTRLHKLVLQRQRGAHTAGIALPKVETTGST